MSAAGISRSSSVTATARAEAPSCRSVRGARGQQQRRHDRDRAQIDERRVREHQTP